MGELGRTYAAGGALVEDAVCAGEGATQVGDAAAAVAARARVWMVSAELVPSGEGGLGRGAAAHFVVEPLRKVTLVPLKTPLPMFSRPPPSPKGGRLLNSTLFWRSTCAMVTCATKPPISPPICVPEIVHFSSGVHRSESAAGSFGLSAFSAVTKSQAFWGEQLVELLGGGAVWAVAAASASSVPPAISTFRIMAGTPDITQRFCPPVANF